MSNKPVKFTSFQQFGKCVSTSTDKWQLFLKEKGHSEDTFSYLPEEIKLSLRISFGRRNNLVTF